MAVQQFGNLTAQTCKIIQFHVPYMNKLSMFFRVLRVHLALIWTITQFHVVVLITTETMLLAHHQNHVLIITTIQFHALKTAQIIMVTQFLVNLIALMQQEIHNSVHLNQFQHGNCSATNFNHALIHQIKFGVYSTSQINQSLLNKFNLERHKPTQFHLLKPPMVLVCKLH